MNLHYFQCRPCFLVFCVKGSPNIYCNLDVILTEVGNIHLVCPSSNPPHPRHRSCLSITTTLTSHQSFHITEFTFPLFLPKISLLHTIFTPTTISPTCSQPPGAELGDVDGVAVSARLEELEAPTTTNIRGGAHPPLLSQEEELTHKCWDAQLLSPLLLPSPVRTA